MVGGFLELADAEGWMCSRWEFDYLFSTFPRGCLVATEDGVPVGFVTSITYGESGWIGNLVVRADFRGRGVGTALMENALTIFCRCREQKLSGLTASQKAGKPIYEGLGFSAIDIINRWVGEGAGGKLQNPAASRAMPWRPSMGRVGATAVMPSSMWLSREGGCAAPMAGFS